MLEVSFYFGGDPWSVRGVGGVDHGCVQQGSKGQNLGGAVKKYFPARAKTTPILFLFFFHFLWAVTSMLLEWATRRSPGADELGV